jgi:hypothetical protein
MGSKRTIVIMLATVALLTPALSFAQSERGSITGVVQDTSKAGIPGVAVNVINTATNATTTVVSSESGAYSATNLPPGPYRIEASLTGFRSAKVDGIRLTAGATARADVILNLGAIEESVTVVANSPLMQTEDAKISTNISNELIDQLPLVVGGAMRSVFDLVSTVPEAKGSGSSVVLGGGQGGAFGATLDGISVNTNRSADTTETAFLTPSVEAITEFAVETNGFKPEFGQAGGGAITFASKSGTNKFQGSLYNFLRNDALDSKGFFEQKKGIYRQNNYGASWGGPVRIPHVYDGANRTFFFVAYEGFQNRQASNALTLSVPTAEMYNGDFSKWVDSQGRLIVIYDPATTRPNPSGAGFIRNPFTGNIIPADRFSAVAKQYLALAKSVVLPNRAGLVPGTFAYVSNNYLSPGGTTIERTNKYSLKIDHTLSKAHRLSYLFNRGKNRLQPGASGAAGLPEPFNPIQISSFDADLHRATWDWIGSRVVNHFTFGVNTFNKDAFSPNVGGNWKDRVCIPNAVDCNVNLGNLTFTEFSPWGGAADNGTEQPRISVKDDVTFVRGSHTVKSGFTFDRQQANGFGQQDIGGRAGFSFLETGIPGATTLATAGGNSFASFLLGAADSGRTETVRYLQQIYPYYSFYAQDDWRINDKLVFNYGVRYEFTQPPRAGGDQYSDFSPTKANPAVNNYPGALVFAGDGPGREGTRSLFPGYYGAVGPRVSVAYSASPRTTFRGGAGRSFGRVTVTQSSSHFAGFIGQYVFASPDSGITPAFNLDQGLPAYPLPPLIDPTFSNNNAVDWFNGQAASRPAVYDNWTVSVQREVRKGMTVELDYNGVYGSHLQAGLLNPNQVPMSVVNAMIAKYGPTQTVALLNSQITSAAAVAAGFTPPYANFTDPNVQRAGRTVAQSLRPYPQYLTVNVQTGGGDKTGRSHYHAGVVKVNQRLSGGLSLQGSYSFSKVMTDADSFSGSGGSMDAARPELEWSVGRFDQTHIIKMNTVYELPFGEGRRWLTTGIANQVLGGWRVALIQAYSSGFPIGVTTNAPLNIFNFTNRPNVTGADWRAPLAGDTFSPTADRFLNRAAFVQPVGALGNAPRINPDVRRFWNLTENMSVAKSIKATHSLDMDIRVEAFNILNRVVWGAPNTDFSSPNFGVISSQGNSPRQMQLGLKLYW